MRSAWLSVCDGPTLTSLHFVIQYPINKIFIFCGGPFDARVYFDRNKLVMAFSCEERQGRVLPSQATYLVQRLNLDHEQFCVLLGVGQT